MHFLSFFLRRKLAARLICGIAATGVLAIAGCDTIGPPAISQSRPDYNESIEKTTKAQNFLNLVRAYCYEPTLFMDVSEVDVALQFQASFGASFALPQARAVLGKGLFYSGNDYTIAPGVQYQESPTIRYTPLQGQALVQQVSTPINMDSLASLYSSDWPLGAMLAMSVDRLTPIDADYYDALDCLIALDGYNAMIVTSTRADPTATGPNDSLMVYAPIEAIRDPETHRVSPDLARRATLIWHRLWAVYGRAQPAGIKEEDHRLILRSAARAFPVSQQTVQRTSERDTSPPAKSTSVSYEVDTPDGKSPTTKETTQVTTPGPQSALKETFQQTSVSAAQEQIATTDRERPYQYMPAITTHSALGILRELTHEDYDVAVFIPADKYRGLVQAMVGRFNKAITKQQSSRFFYVFDSKPFTGQGFEKPGTTRETYETPRESKSDEIWHAQRPGEPQDDLNLVNDQGLQDFQEEKGYDDHSDRLRHFIIVVYQEDSCNTAIPGNAFVTMHCDNKTFFIDGDDIVSQKNFALMSQFLTIQAVPGAAPLTPTIAVAGH